MSRVCAQVFSFQSSFMRISFCEISDAVVKPLQDFFKGFSFNPLLWGFLFASRIFRGMQQIAPYKNYYTFQSSFMRISFCEKWKHEILPQLIVKSFLHFQSSFMRISFCEGAGIAGLISVLGTKIVFQSSFMRISFCERWYASTNCPKLGSSQSFNPLLWGFLFASSAKWIRKIHGYALSILFYEDFFLRVQQA